MEAILTPSMEAAKPQPLCEMCKAAERKYKCPRCDISTCSLDCCRQHKTQFQCTGQRERIKFISSSEFTEKHLRQDFHFLEDVLQTRAGAKRSYAHLYDDSAQAKFTNPSAINSMSAKQSLQGYAKNVKLLVSEAAKRSTKVLVQPVGMSRRKENTTNFNAKKQLIFWRIALVFIMTENFKMSEILHVTSQTMDQLQAIKAPAICLHINSCSELENVADIRRKVLASIQSGSILRQVMKNISLNQNSLHCLLRVIPSPADNPLFREVDQTSSVRDSLSSMTVIEYPTFYFCSAAVLYKFRLLVHDPQHSAASGTRGDMMVDISTGHEVHEDEQTEKKASDRGPLIESPTPELSLRDDENNASTNNQEVTEAAMLVSPPKKRTYGGLLNLDYGSSSDEEDEVEETEEQAVEVGMGLPASLPAPQLPVGSSTAKYGDFFKQLSALQQLGHAGANREASSEVEDGEVEEEEEEEPRETESDDSSAAMSDDESSGSSDSDGMSNDEVEAD